MCQNMHENKCECCCKCECSAKPRRRIVATILVEEMVPRKSPDGRVVFCLETVQYHQYEQ